MNVKLYLKVFFLFNIVIVFASDRQLIKKSIENQFDAYFDTIKDEFLIEEDLFNSIKEKIRCLKAKNQENLISKNIPDDYTVTNSFRSSQNVLPTSEFGEKLFKFLGILSETCFSCDSIVVSNISRQLLLGNGRMRCQTISSGFLHDKESQKIHTPTLFFNNDYSDFVLNHLDEDSIQLNFQYTIEWNLACLYFGFYIDDVCCRKYMNITDFSNSEWRKKILQIKHVITSIYWALNSREQAERALIVNAEKFDSNNLINLEIMSHSIYICEKVWKIDAPHVLQMKDFDNNFIGDLFYRIKLQVDKSKFLLSLQEV